MKYILYAFSLPVNILAVPIVLLIHLLFGESLFWSSKHLCLCTVLRQDSWPRNPKSKLPFAGWYAEWAGTTLGNAIIFGSSKDLMDVVLMHEFVHVKQFETTMLQSFILALCTLPFGPSFLVFYAVWSSGVLSYLAANRLSARLRRKDPYWGSLHEEHAYTATKEDK
jgi:hypothetical protein